jgi:hypothetical protein
MSFEGKGGYRNFDAPTSDQRVSDRRPRPIGNHTLGLRGHHGDEY